MTADLYTATTPAFEVEGQLSGELGRDLAWLEVSDDTSGLKQLTASFVGSSPSAPPGVTDYLDGRLDFGMGLACSVGPDGGHRYVFRGQISAIEVHHHEGGVPMVTVRAEDELMRLRMTRRSKTYELVTDADIAAAVAEAHGLSAEVDADGPTYDLVQQFNQTDLAFLRDRAERINAEVWADDGTIGFATRDRRSGTQVTLVRGNELIEVEARADLAHLRTEVQVSGYNAGTRSTIDERADSSALASEAGGGRLGVDLLKRAIGDRPTARLVPVPLTGDEGSTLAEAAMVRRGRGFVQVSGTTSGTADMMVGSRVTLERVGPAFDGGGYYVTGVCHNHDRINGFRTRFEAERSTIGGGL